MNDPAGEIPMQRGWYADPAGLPQQRWWDGERWTEHLHDPERNAYGDDGAFGTAGAFGAAGVVGPRASVFNNFIWAIALFPVVSFLALTSAGTASPLLGYGISICSVVLAFLDRGQLERDGMERPFHWVWALLSPGVYVVGRSLVVRRRTGSSLAPMWVWAAIMLVYVLTALGKEDGAAAAVASLASSAACGA